MSLISFSLYLVFFEAAYASGRAHLRVSAEKRERFANLPFFYGGALCIIAGSRHMCVLRCAEM